MILGPNSDCVQMKGPNCNSLLGLGHICTGHFSNVCRSFHLTSATAHTPILPFLLELQHQGRRGLMVEVWWSLLGAAIPAVVAGQAYRMRRRHSEEQKIKTARGREKNPDEIFVCERVCTSKRMLKKVGSFSKDPIPDTCVTVCGVSELDACTDACARTVCVNQHQVPNWNDVCLRRCQSECLKLSASHSS